VPGFIDSARGAQNSGPLSRSASGRGASRTGPWSKPAGRPSILGWAGRSPGFAQPSSRWRDTGLGHHRQIGLPFTVTAFALSRAAAEAPAFEFLVAVCAADIEALAPAPHGCGREVPFLVLEPLVLGDETELEVGQTHLNARRASNPGEKRGIKRRRST
jgi:hypothetical protein